MIFTNYAFLSYNNGTVISNTVIGEVTAPLSILKNASVSTYSSGAQIQYSVTIRNFATVDYSSLTLTDNLGQYIFSGSARFPLSYVDSSAVLTYYNSSDVTQGSVSASVGQDGVSFVFDIPAKTTAILSYITDITVFAPITAGSQITNTAALTGNAPFLPLNTSDTISVREQAQVTITKYAEETAIIGEPFTFTFFVSNYGNIAVTDTDFTILSDSLNPNLQNIKVTADNTPWTSGVEYVYDDNLFFFQTQPGAIRLNAATITQDGFGRFAVSPSTIRINVTGTVVSIG